MRVIVASDIHGITPELCMLVDRFSTDAVLLSPWEQPGCPFASEGEAHAAFVATGSIEAYAEKIAEVAVAAPAFIVGFSAGATATWLYSAHPQSDCRSRAVLFYGSRIRLYPHIAPRFPIRAVFAEHEPSFQPAALASRICQQNVAVEIEANAIHGFMNPLSAAYSSRLAEKHIAAIRSELFLSNPI